MGRVRFGPLCLAVLPLAVALVAAGCGGSSTETVTGPSEATAPATGNAVIQGALVGGGVAASSTGGLRALGSTAGIQVSVVGTSVACPLDEEGQFTLFGLPAGQVILHFTGPGVDAKLTVSGLADGQILVIEVHLSGSTATLATAPGKVMSANIRFGGKIESINGSMLVISSRRVEGATVRKVSRGYDRINLGDLKVGEKVVVEGTLRADGVVEAYQIAAEGPPEAAKGSWIYFKGRVDSVSMSSLDLHASCYPTLIVAGRRVHTDGGTAFKWSDGASLDASLIVVGDQAYVEGWQRDGYVQATKVVLDRR